MHFYTLVHVWGVCFKLTYFGLLGNISKRFWKNQLVEIVSKRSETFRNVLNCFKTFAKIWNSWKRFETFQSVPKRFQELYIFRNDLKRFKSVWNVLRNFKLIFYKSFETIWNVSKRGNGKNLMKRFETERMHKLFFETFRNI